MTTQIDRTTPQRGSRPKPTGFAKLARWWETGKVQGAFGTLLLNVIVVGGMVLLMVPLAWMLSTSLKPLGRVAMYPPEWIPNPPLWRNYIDAFIDRPFGVFVRNTVLVTGLSMIGQLLSCSAVAYGFARLRFPGRDALFFIMLGTMMIPSYVTLIPTFILFKFLGWLNTYFPLIVPAYFGSAFYVFLLRQFYMTIPLEMDDAAKIDGAGFFQLYSRILLPQIRPALGAVAIFSFIGHWNDFFGPLIYLNEQRKWTLALGLTTYQGHESWGKPTQWNLMMCAALMALIPCILVFFFAQRIFIQGIVMTGVEK